MADDDEVQTAYLESETVRLSMETDRLNEGANLQARWRAARSGQPLAPRGDRPLQEVEWDEQPGVAHLSYQDLDEAVFTVARTLADRTGNTVQAVLSAVDGMATGRSEIERAEAVVALSGAVDAFGEDDVLSLSVLTQEDREKSSAHTIPGSTDFPIPDKGHLLAAVARFKQGKLAGHSEDEVASHIRKHAKRLGVSVSLDDDANRPEHEDKGPDRRPQRTGEDVSMAAQLARSAREVGIYSASDMLRLAADRAADYEERTALLDAAELRDIADEQGMDPAEGEVARLTRSYYPEEFGMDPAVSLAAGSHEGRRADAEAERLVGEHWDMFPASKIHDAGSRTGSASHSGKRHPSRTGKPVTTGQRAHAPGADDASTDHHAAVQGYLRMLKEMNGSPEDDRGGAGGMSRTHRPDKTGCAVPLCDANTSGPRSDYCVKHQIKGYVEHPAEIHGDQAGAHPREVR
jgi:hypothetical protein